MEGVHLVPARGREGKMQSRERLHDAEAPVLDSEPVSAPILSQSPDTDRPQDGLIEGARALEPARLAARGRVPPALRRRSAGRARSRGTAVDAERRKLAIHIRRAARGDSACRGTGGGHDPGAPIAASPALSFFSYPAPVIPLDWMTEPRGRNPRPHPGPPLPRNQTPLASRPAAVYKNSHTHGGSRCPHRY